MVHLLVVAPSSSLRNSLRFALEAEGYTVTAVTSVDDLDEPAASFDCAVVDHHGLTSFTSESRRFLKEFEPVVLLANTPAHPMAGYTFRTLTKPFLGPALSEAVKRALATRASAWSSAPPPRQDG
ncbi:MAG: hypothetical protein J0I99_13405 [Devosia sp.]|uniref:hypothetical protein n=1 Tax=Devosia sp. TaxID=1871048 RepID=UPI001ACF6308|nr:hypothetical protein [Devosia sp.]MBN9316732.1 hypothetical protein [Devosia sp.]